MTQIAFRTSFARHRASTLRLVFAGLLALVLGVFTLVSSTSATYVSQAYAIVGKGVTTEVPKYLFHEIPIEGDAWRLAVNATKNEVYVSNYFNGFRAVDGNTRTLTTNITVPGQTTYGIGVDQVTGDVFMGAADSQAIFRFNGSNVSQYQKLPGFYQFVRSVLVDSATHTIWAIGSDLIYRVNGQTLQVESVLGISNAYFREAVLDPATHTLYLSNSSLRNTVTVINGDTMDKDSMFDLPVGQWPRGLDFNPKTNRLYVANRDAHTVSVVDTVTRKEIQRIAVGYQPIGVAVDATRNVIYVTHDSMGGTPSYDGYYVGDGDIYVIDGATNTFTDVIGTPGGVGGTDVKVNPVNGTVYAISGTSLYEIIKRPV